MCQRAAAQRVWHSGTDGARDRKVAAQTIANDGYMNNEPVGGVSDADAAGKLKRGIGLGEASHRCFQQCERKAFPERLKIAEEGLEPPTRGL